MSSSVTCSCAGDPEAAPQVQDEQIQGQVGFEAADVVGIQGLFHVRDKHGVHGLFVAEPGDVVEGAAVGGLKIRALGVEEVQAGDGFQDAAQFEENRVTAPGFIRFNLAGQQLGA